MTRQTVAMVLLGWILWLHHGVRPDGVPEGGGQITTTRLEAMETKKECIIAHQRAVLDMHRNGSALRRELETRYGSGELHPEPDGVRFSMGTTGLIFWLHRCLPDTIDPDE